jgi:hypothetical protein
METKPHGWAFTQTGSMVHYFGLSYRPDGTPVALCHNALRMGAKAVFQDKPNGYEWCDSCQNYLTKHRKEAQSRAAQAKGKFAVGVTVDVTRGKGVAGTSGTLLEACKGFPGFWMVKLAADKPVMLSEGQLQVKK